jgi:O-succinylhomoserine sulfhydrylase
MDSDSHFDTRAIRAGSTRSEFLEHSEAMFLTSSFLFESAADAAEHFKPGTPGFVYSRFSNPSVSMFQDRLASLEGGEACLATASGMAAIFAVCLAVLKAGDHVICSRSVFGATTQLFDTVLSRFGVVTSYVNPTSMDEWRAALRPETRLCYFETPSNPLGDVVDIGALKQVLGEHPALIVADNCLCTPALQRPLSLGAHVVIHSATKYIDGQGRVLGGAVVGSADFVEKQVLPVMRTTGPSLSAFNAWVLLKGLETLAIRMERHCSNALELATWLEAQPMISKVYYPGLASHPQHALALRQQSLGGAVVSFEVKGDAAHGQARAWQVIDACTMLSITGNLGDTRTTITHPGTTTHGRLTPEQRAEAGISDALVRVSVGLEHIDDIKADLRRGLQLLS